MYEDSWYSYVPDSHKDDVGHNSTGHRRKESLLKQPNGLAQQSDLVKTANDLFSAPKVTGPPQATLTRRAKSYSDFYEAATQFLSKQARIKGSEDPQDALSRQRRTKATRTRFEECEDELLNSSQEAFQLYQDQLDLSERHLVGLIEDTTLALDLLHSLSDSFNRVEAQTTAFQSQCEDLLSDQKRIRDLADEVGLSVQYYAYLEPLTRRLNAPGSGRIVKSEDFLDMLTNLNTCIAFMEEHPNYRDASTYKTRYSSLLEKALNLVQMAFSSALRDISDEVSRQLKLKDQSETAEYILLYGKYENVVSNLGTQVGRLLTTDEYAFGQTATEKPQPSYFAQWHEFYRQLLDTYFKSREQVGPLISKNLRKLASKDPKPETDFKSFARRCAQYVFDICENEWLLAERYFRGGPLFATYPDLQGETTVKYISRFEDHRLSHLTILFNFLAPYLHAGDLQRICDFNHWLETIDSHANQDEIEDDRKPAVQALLSKHLWPLSDTLFLKAAKDIEYFRPAAKDLELSKQPEAAAVKAVTEIDEKIYDSPTPAVSTAFPTVKTAVKLLVMYNDGAYDRPRSGDVLYEIVHQATESLQKAATIIKRNSNIMDAQLFLIRNLMLIENLFMTHEIPDSVRQSAEYDFSPIWNTIKELQDRRQLFNPLAYLTPLVRGKLLPAVVDQLLDARKELERVLVQQITAFTKYWQSRLAEKDPKKREAVGKATNELNALLNKVFDDETTKIALWKMIRAEN